MFRETQSLVCYHYTIGLRYYRILLRTCRMRGRLFKFLLVKDGICRSDITAEIISLYKPPVTTLRDHLINYFQRMSKASRLLQSLDLFYLLWTKFFASFIALQNFKPTTSGSSTFIIVDIRTKLNV